MSASFLPLISKPTRVANQSATLIDNIFCNILPLPESGIILSDISDHYPIFAQIPIKLTTKQKIFQKRRKTTPENLTTLKNSLAEIDWSFLNTSDINLSYENFIKTINTEIDNHIPLCNIKNNYKRTPRLPWITKSLLRSINRKNNLFYKYRSNPPKNQGKNTFLIKTRLLNYCAYKRKITM